MQRQTITRVLTITVLAMTLAIAPVHSQHLKPGQLAGSFEGQWAGWWTEYVPSYRDWGDIKYWIVDISKINDTLYRGNFNEYHFERHEKRNPGKLVRVVSKGDIDLFCIPSKKNPDIIDPQHDYIIYFNAAHTPYGSPADSIQGYFVVHQVFSRNVINILNFRFKNKSHQNSGYFFVHLMDVTSPGMEFPLSKDQLPSFISNLILDKPGPKPQMFEGQFYADLILMENKLALSGRHPIGTKVTLFNHLTGEIFITHIMNTGAKRADFWGDIQYSQLADVPNWENEKLHLYTTVFLGEVQSEISFLETLLRNDLGLNESLHFRLLRNGVLKKAAEELIADQKSKVEIWKKLSRRLPSVYKISGFEKELLFFTYRVTDDGGPAFLLVGEKLFTLPGQCSSIPNFYLSNGILYLRHVSGECGDGTVLVGNYAVFSDELVEDYISFGYSN